MVAETIGQRDKKNQNLVYYRQMDHADKMLMAKALSNPWRYNKKRTIVDELWDWYLSQKTSSHLF